MAAQPFAIAPTSKLICGSAIYTVDASSSITNALISVCLSLIHISYANDYGTPQETITITDKETGEVTKYTLDEDDIQSQVSIDENTGEKSITAIYEFGQDSEIDPFTTSSTQDELNGWRGNVQITYTAVSYTHLDVYKRQYINSVVINL